MNMSKTRFPACILATAVISWTEDWCLDEAIFRRQISILLANGYRNLYIFGTAGEGYAVTVDRFLHVARIFVDEMRRGGAEPMVGVVSLSLPTITARIEATHALGVRYFQMSLPSRGVLDDQEMDSLFEQVLGRFTDCQFLHYNLLRAKRLVTAAEYARLAERYPNLVATKNSTDAMGRIRDLIGKAPQMQHFLTERGFAYGSLIGECGLLISVAISNLAMGHRYFEAGRARDVQTLLRMEAELSRMVEALIEYVGGGARIDGAYDKVNARLHDPDFPLSLVPPYRGASTDAQERYLAYLREQVPHWAPPAS